MTPDMVQQALLLIALTSVLVMPHVVGAVILGALVVVWQWLVHFTRALGWLWIDAKRVIQRWWL